MGSYTYCLSLVYFFLFVLAFATATSEEGLSFLAANREKPGVITLDSGLQYKILNNGTGTFHPKVGTSCLCHYHGQLIDGTVFDSSYDRGQPITFAPNQVIKGWTEAMQRMVKGDKWELYIPSELGYGDQGSPPKIPGGAVLVFQMEMLDILGDDVVPALKCRVDTKDECNEQEIAYIEGKIASWDESKMKNELQRLKSMTNKAMKPELEEWIHRRIHLLEQVVTSGDEL